MKKTALIVLVMLLVSASVFAATSTLYNKYGNIIKTGEYTIKGTVYTMDSNGNKKGSGSNLVVAEHNGSYYMEVEESGQKMRIIIQAGKYYMIDDSGKTIISMIFEEGDDEDTVDFPVNYNITKSGSGRFDGMNLSYETTNDDGTETTYWYSGNTLYAMESKESDGTRSAFFISTFEQKVDPSLFNLPADYEVVDMSGFGSFLGGMDGSSGSDEDWAAALAGIDWDSLFADTDWSNSSWDDSDWGYSNDYDPHYYAFGLLMGLTSAQARAFEESMNSFNNIDWLELNYYYDSDTDRYDLQGTQLSDAAYIGSYDLDKINNLIKKFK